jgi:hypothetical protein
MTHVDESAWKLANGVVVSVSRHDPVDDEWRLSWMDSLSWSTVLVTLDDLDVIGEMLSGYVSRMRQTGGEPDAGPRLPGF